MAEEQPKRRQRNPLSAEELKYLIKLKILKQEEKVDAFKGTKFYKTFNFFNIILYSILSYYIFSVCFACNWQEEIIKNVSYSRRGGFVANAEHYSITEVELETYSGKYFVVKTDLFFAEPAVFQHIYIGRDFVFNKIIKTKFCGDDREFWNLKTYPSFILCSFSLLLGLYIYRLDRHLNVNGLLMAFGLFFLSCLYFICI